MGWHILEMIAAMTVVLASWAALAALLVGTGLLARRAWGLRGNDVGASAAAFWTGLAIAVGLLQLWHLLLPAGPAALGLLAAAAAAGFALAGRGLLRSLGDAARRHKLAAVAMALLALWLANRATGPCRHTDSGLYHLQVVRWYRQYPVVPGLGNLHVRYASNNANLLLAAATDAGPLRDRSAHVVNSLLICALLAHAVAGAARLRSADHARRARGAFDAALLVMGLQMSNHWMVSSHSTDVLPAVCSAVAASHLVALLLGGDRDDRRRGGRTVLVVALLAAAVCGKLTAAPFALAATALVAVWWLRAGRPGGARTVLWALAAVGLLLGPWVAHGLILSGWAVYPLPVLSTGADWRVPVDLVRSEWDYIAGSGRSFGVLTSWNAWKALAGRWQRDVLVPAGVALVAAGAWALLRLRRRPGRKSAPWVMLLPTAAAIAAWLAVSPQRRLGFHLIWIAAGTLLAMLAAAARPRPGRRTLTLLLAVWAALGVANLKKFYTPPAAGGFHPTPSADLREVRTRWGLRVPVAPGGYCWDAPIPCTPHAHRNLRLRRERDLSSGFRIQPPDR
jgi:hypothetical protein